MRRLRRRSARAALVPALVWCSACSGAYFRIEKSPEYERVLEGPYRVAVLPFSVSAGSDFFLVDALAFVAEVLTLGIFSSSPPPVAESATILRRALVARLSGGPLSVADLWITDTELHHRGLEALGPAEGQRIAEALGVDGVLFGEVTAWNRSYYVAQTTVRVGLRLSLVDRRGGDRVFFEERCEVAGAGLTGGPTGPISAVSAPIGGLSGATVEELARAVARRAAADLSGGRAGEEPGGPAGELARLSFWSVSLGGRRALRAGDALTVVAVGSPGAELRFDIGRYATGIPMRASAVADDPRGARATYVGSYVVQEGEKLGATPVYVTVRDPGGRRSLASRVRVSSPLVAIDA